MVHSNAEHQEEDWLAIHEKICPIVTVLRSPQGHANSEEERQRRQQQQLLRKVCMWANSGGQLLIIVLYFRYLDPVLCYWNETPTSVLLQLKWNKGTYRHSLHLPCGAFRVDSFTRFYSISKLHYNYVV